MLLTAPTKGFGTDRIERRANLARLPPNFQCPHFALHKPGTLGGLCVTAFRHIDLAQFDTKVEEARLLG